MQASHKVAELLYQQAQQNQQARSKAQEPDTKKDNEPLEGEINNQ